LTWAGDAFDIRGMKILVIGLGITGKACANVLPGLGAAVSVTDLRDDLTGLQEAVDYVESRGADFVERERAADTGPDIVVASPGIDPKDGRLDALRTPGAEWMSEIEIAFRLSGGKILAVTGTNGKSTCVTLAGEILGKRFGDVRVSGNIGSPFVEAAAGSTGDTIHVIEVSSYQLEGCRLFRPDAAIVLNVREDHMTRHPTMELYAAAKARMLQRMGPEDLAVLFKDDPLVWAMAEKTRARIAGFSTVEQLEEGAFLRGGSLVIRMDGESEEICRLAEMKLRGKHNAENVLAVSLATMFLGAQPEEIREAAAEFTGLEHRIQTVGVVNGIECVNDSKATNVDSAIAALETFAGRDVTIILGGDDKGFDYEPLYETIENAGARVVMLGYSLERVAEGIQARGKTEYARAASMKEAVEKGLEMTRAGGVLLLAPSSSSFDLYSDFTERGRDFTNEIKRKKDAGSKEAGTEN